VRAHLEAPLPYQHKLLRFVENHDEPRALAVMGPERERAAAVVVATVPGAKLYHDGQLSGRQIQVSVHLGREPDEAADSALEVFYDRLMRAAKDILSNNPQWQLCDTLGWPDNHSSVNILAWCWTAGERPHLIAVNYSDSRSQAQIVLPPDLGCADDTCVVTDLLDGSSWTHSRAELVQHGLFVDLQPWQSHILRFATRAESEQENHGKTAGF
jgi:hypothetical protein